MLDRIRTKSDTLIEHIAAKPALYLRMRALVRSKIMTSESCRLAIAQTLDAPTKKSAGLIYNRCYDLANLGNENAVDMLREIAETTAIGITLGGQRFGPAEYVPQARAA